MQALTIKTNKSDYPFLVIADGFISAVEVLYQKGIYGTDIISVPPERVVPRRLPAKGCGATTERSVRRQPPLDVVRGAVHG